MTDSTTVYIETFGCQMNKLDSELVLSVLSAEGFTPAHRPEEASVVLLNTCSVREHAEKRVYSRLADLGKRAEREPDLVVGVIGCMAQRVGSALFERCPWVRIVCGPTHLGRLPDLVRKALAGLGRLEAVAEDVRAPAPGWDPPRTLPGAASSGAASAQRFVRIMRGCNNFCTYCIVPYVRGPEVSRPMEDIVEEVRRLVDEGCLEVTLLGQNVNSYRHGEVRLPRLLERLDAVEGLRRIRFVTSHPRDLTDDILRAMADLEKVCEHLHLPAQAGSDSELARMNRGYTRAQYLRIVERARELMPGIGLVSDFIVGFPGETEEEFRATLSLVETVRYKNCFVFRYSPRPGTAAAGMPDDVPRAVKQARLEELLALQREIALADNRAWVGRRVEVLVEGPSKRARRKPLPPPGEGSEVQLVGRTRSDHIVVFDGPLELAGRLVEVDVADASDLTLFGRLPRKDTR